MGRELDWDLQTEILEFDAQPIKTGRNGLQSSLNWNP
jgi:hypothetical protein